MLSCFYRNFWRINPLSYSDPTAFAGTPRLCPAAEQPLRFWNWFCRPWTMTRPRMWSRLTSRVNPRWRTRWSLPLVDQLRQVAAMAQKLMDRLKETFRLTARVEGKDTGDWVLIDTGDVVCPPIPPRSARILPA